MAQTASDERSDDPKHQLNSEKQTAQEEVFQAVQLTEATLTFEMIKSAIYLQNQLLFERGVRATLLKLSPDIYEILNKRLVFKTPAHKDLAHFITPHGNLRVSNETNSLQEPRSFLIE